MNNEKHIGVLTRAINEKLHVFAYGYKGRKDSIWVHPEEFDAASGQVTMVKSDCGSIRNSYDVEVWDIGKFISIAGEDGQQLYKKVGMWDFTPVGNPAANDIYYAHSNPASAGNNLYLKRKRIEELEKEVVILKGIMERYERELKRIEQDLHDGCGGHSELVVLRRVIHGEES